MHVLYLTNGFPFPLTSGYLRHYHLIKHLAEEHGIAVSLFSIVGPRFQPEYVEALRPYTRRVATFSTNRRGVSKPRKALQTLAGLVQSEPAVEAMRAAIARLAQEDPIDVIVGDKHSAQALGQAPIAPLVGDMCDASSKRIRRRIPHSGPLRAPFLWMEYHQMRRAERALLRRAAHVLFISQRDQLDLMADQPSPKPITIISNGVDADFWHRQSDRRQMDTIVFTGAMDYQPNVDAALYLIREILPEVHRTVPTAELLIVGRDPKPELVALGNQPHVTVTGFVEDVRPYLERATVYAAPLRFGAGVQNKVLEAMAMEVPVVASPLAAAGLRTPGGDEPPIMVAEGREAFVREIVRHLERARTAPAPDAAGRRFVETHFVWRAIADTLARLLEQTASKGRGRS